MKLLINDSGRKHDEGADTLRVQTAAGTVEVARLRGELDPRYGRFQITFHHAERDDEVKLSISARAMQGLSEMFVEFQQFPEGHERWSI